MTADPIQVTRRVFASTQEQAFRILPGTALLCVTALSLVETHPGLPQDISYAIGAVRAQLDLLLKARYPHALARISGPDDLRPIFEDPTPQVLSLAWPEVWWLVTGIQLATRHPEMAPKLREGLTAIGRAFQGAFAGDTEVFSLLELGWDEAYDTAPDD